MDITVFNYTFHNVQLNLFSWDSIYSFLGIKEFIYFISSPTIQQTLFPVKLVFFFFTLVFLIAVIWFYLNSSYLQYKFLQDTKEFISKGAAGLGKINARWKTIKKKMDSGTEADAKLAVIEADDFLYEVLQDAAIEGDSFDDLISNASKKVRINAEEILKAHAVRNSIVYEPDYHLDDEQAKRIMSVYENSIKNIALI